MNPSGNNLPPLRMISRHNLQSRDITSNVQLVTARLLHFILICLKKYTLRYKFIL